MMVIIFSFSSIPGSVIDTVGLGKESYHVNGHFFLFFLLCLALYKGTKKYGLSLFITFVYGVLDEMHQYFVPFRSVSSFDVLTDFMGGLLAIGVLWNIFPLLPKKLNNWLLK
jgi:VanZ family protein